MEPAKPPGGSPAEPPEAGTELRAAAEVELASNLLRDLREANQSLLLASLRSEERVEETAQADDVFNALPDVVIRYDRELRPLYLNSTVERLTARSRSALLGQREDGLTFGPLHADIWNAILLETFAHGRSTERLLTFQSPDGPRTFHVRTVPERNRAGVLATVVALARDVTESEIYRARGDVDRLSRLEVLAEAFSAAPTCAAVASVLVREGRAVLQADAAFVELAGAAGEAPELELVAGGPPELTERWRTRAPSAERAALLSEVHRSGQALFFSSRRDLLARYPDLTRAPHQQDAVDEALAVLPLTTGGRSFGAAAVVFRQPRAFEQADRMFFASVARHAAQALDRARLLEAAALAQRDAAAAAAS